ncbi:Tubulin-tyrosine ligase family protein [Tritrichomonas foetus]|uniref:Tubulin-tyrosine ligase family protein n=1 Tax=Tritrichomonas foetus TaxID=1144522 RepID=A0A1J4KHF1_9EUKA|nr:Tubulin-tyrosine ligase family protein [Tritrichomonas foetus]|eukprot:OHT08757.1 Tubulin-tyrosine ligase family protein [Tritrichomonas foetus]
MMLPPKTKIDIQHVHYTVTKQALEELDLTQTKNDKSADIIWWDGFIQKDQFLKVLPHQRINKFPSMDVLCYKSSTFRFFNNMRTLYPKVYSFYPLTFILPAQFQDFQKEYLRHATKSNNPITWIFKPRAGCSGNGIRLVQNSFDVADSSYAGVIQRYVSPYLIDGYKFDFRLYIFVPTISPFTVYIYREGLARFCTNKYEPPSQENLGDMFCHLSNTSINVKNKNSRNSIIQFASRILTRIRKMDPRGRTLWAKIKYVVMLSMVAQYAQIIERIKMQENECKQHQINKQPNEENNENKYINNNNEINGKEPLPFEQRFFHILGIDIMVNEDCEPVVLELNDRPSMMVTFGMEQKLKTELNLEAMRMVSLDGKPPGPDVPTGKWEKIMPVDESTQLGIGLKRIMDRSLQTIKNESVTHTVLPKESLIKKSVPTSSRISPQPSEKSTLPSLYK